MSKPTRTPEVMTLSEAAKYLRVSQAGLKRDAESGKVPAREINGQWRFLKSALHEWLSRATKPNGTSGFMAAFGAFKDDETLPQLRQLIQEARKRDNAEESKR
jgi:excisionase family DNA binding protein